MNLVFKKEQSMTNENKDDHLIRYLLFFYHIRHFADANFYLKRNVPQRITLGGRFGAGKMTLVKAYISRREP
jgi:hypothetical protein